MASIDPDEEDLEFQVFDWYMPESDRAARELAAKAREERGGGYVATPVRQYEIFMYGATAEGHSVCARVTGFEPYFFVKPPESWWTKMNTRIAELQTTILTGYVERSWMNPKTKKRETYTTKIVPKRLQDHLVEMKHVKRKDFWGFTNGRDFPFIKVKVRSLEMFNKLKRYFQDRASEGFKLYESNIDPFLRFIHMRNIAPCGWVRLPAKRYAIESFDESSGDSSKDAQSNEDAPEDTTGAHGESRAAFHVTVQATDVYPLDIAKIAPIRVASFDLECTSSHGDFPVARKDYRKLAQNLVAAAAMRPGFSPEDLREWIAGAFRATVDTAEGVTVHVVYPKQNPNKNALVEAIDGLLEDAYPLVQKAVKDRKKTGQRKKDDADEEEEESNENIGTAEEQLVRVLTSALPALKGDPIIQIGTTVHRYGSDEITYRHICTLGTCDAIDGADVESFETEEELIIGWKDVIARLDPDILTGYNIFGFDMPYIQDRVRELGIVEEFCTGLGRLRERRTTLLEQRLSSSALGDNFLYYWDLDGIVCIDMLKVMQRDHKLDSYKLDHVAEVFLGDRKNDLKPREIFEKQGGSSADRCEIARYCIQDCALVNRLLHKLKVLENNIGMGNVCSVPLSYLFMRGQGVKIFSLVAKECAAKKHLVPVVRNFKENEMDMGDDDGYEGAIVLEPKTGMYLEDPITVLDYSSLYPSSMIARNLSHDCYVNDESYCGAAAGEGVTFLTVKYDVYQTVAGKKTKLPEQKECKFAQLPEGKKGIIPSILQKLLAQRKATRKKIEYETIELSDGRVAQGLVIREDGETLDVVNVDTNHKATLAVADIVARRETYSVFEQAVLDALQLAYKVTANSLYGQIGARTSPIYWKDIAACTTATGREMIMTAKNFVEKEYGAEVIYGDSVTGDTPLLVRYPDGRVDVKTIETLSNDWIEYERFKPWDAERTDKEQAGFEGEVWANGEWARVARVIRHKVNKKMYRVNTFQGCVDVTEDHSLVAKNGEKIKPTECVVGETEVAHSFPIDLSGYVANGNFAVTASKFDNKLDAMRAFTEWNAKGIINIAVYEHAGTYELIPLAQSFDFKDVVLRVTELDCKPEYVYDIETSKGQFNGGVGRTVCWNTDSIFLKFDHSSKAPVGLQRVQCGIAAGQRAAREIKPLLPPPQSLEYEKTMWPFILLSKKRYVGNLYEDDANKKPKQKSMGIVLKRRDNAPIVKVVYGGIIDILLNKHDLAASVDFLRGKLDDLVNGRVPLDQLVITKTLRAEYKDPTKIAHKVLADRMGARDPGNKPAANDRIPFVYIKVGNDDKVLQGDRIEHPDYIKEAGITPDYAFYITNQLMKPICQLFALCVDKLPEYSFEPGYWEQIDEELSGVAMYADAAKRKNRIEALRMRTVEQLLFAPFLTFLGCGKVTRARAARPAKSAAAPPASDLTLDLCVELKDKLYVCKAELRDVGAAEPLWTHHSEKTRKGNKGINKTNLYQTLAETAFQEIAAGPHGERARSGGLAIRVADAPIMRIWRRVLEGSAAITKEEYDKTMATCDTGKLKEMQEIMAFERLAAVAADIPYTLGLL
jgi:DNA polymerase elongation subunit (family B)